jgi:hypothetical protein
MLAPLALLLLAAAPRPDWVDGMPAAFPRDRFLVAVGTADERAAAELRARAGISAFFETRVTSAARVEETEARARGGGLELRFAAIAASQEVSAVTAKLLEGVEIAEAWVDPQGRAYALAVLERARAVEVLRRRLAEVDADVAAAAARLEGERARFARARLAYRIVATAARRAPLVQDLRALEPGAEPAPPPGAEGARAAAERALGEVAVAVRAKGVEVGPALAAATRAVVAVGMRATAAGAPHDLAAAIAVESEPAASVDGWAVVRLTADVRVVETGRPDAVVAFVETAKGTSGRREEATRRAGEALAARIEERLHDELRARLE